MEEQDVEIFISNLTLKLNVYCFDFLASVPLPFCDLAKANRVSDKEAVRSLHLPSGYGKSLKDFLKPIKERESAKRKQKNSCCHGSSAKIMKADKHQAYVTDTCTVDTSDVLYTTSNEDNTIDRDEEEQDQDYIDFDDSETKIALQKLNSFLEEENLDKLKKVFQHSKDKRELEIGLGIHMFSKLMGEAYTSRETSLQACPCGCQAKHLGHENMWIGSENTWYGELDIIAGNPVTGDAVSVSVKNISGYTEFQVDDGDTFEGEEIKDEENDKEEDTDTDDSPGDEKKVEALNQVIAQAVVFAFTEYNSHTSKGKVIPSVLIDEKCFQYVIYSPVDDILLVSNYMMFNNMEDFDRKSGFRPFIVLWIILNHRLFFKKCPDFRRHFIKSGFHENIHDLQQFQNLRDYSKIICPKQNLHFPNDTPNSISTKAMDWFLDK